MRRTTKTTILATLMSAAMAAAIAGLTSVSASAIDVIPCNTDSKNEFVHMTYHFPSTGDREWCLANGGETYGPWDPDVYDESVWVTKIWTGNNRVQWYGDGRWQPDQPIGKWTTMTWSSHPGGIKLDKIRIV